MKFAKKTSGLIVMATPVVWLILSMLSAGSMAYYVTEIWSANQPPGFSDLYARWWGAHELFLHGRNPYSPAVSHEIQTVIYGAPVTPSADDPAGVGGGFAYPPYVAFLLWPTVYMSFPAVQKVFLLVSVLVMLLTLTLWLRLLRLHLPPLTWVITALFVLGSFPALEAIRLQNLSLIAAALIATALFLLSSNRLIPAGIFLAVSTFKPQFLIALVPWLLLWTLADWRRRRSLAWSFLATMAALVVVSEWYVPGWISSFLSIAGAYRHYAYGYSVLDVWFNPTFGPIASVVLLLTALALGWRHRSESADSPRFVLVTSMLLAANVVAMPTLAPHAQLLLLPGCLCLLPSLTSRWSVSSFARTLRATAGMLLAWPWLATFALLVAAIRVPTARLLGFWQVPLYPSPLLPLAVALALGFQVRSRPGPRDQDALGLGLPAPMSAKT